MKESLFFGTGDDFVLMGPVAPDGGSSRVEDLVFNVIQNRNRNNGNDELDNEKLEEQVLIST